VNPKKILIWSGLGILLSIATIYVVEIFDPLSISHPRIMRVRPDIQSFSRAVDLYKEDYKVYPESLAELVPEHIKRSPRPDPWGNDYVYIHDSKTYEIYSVGKNGIDEYKEGDDVVLGDKLDSCEIYRINCPMKITEYIRLFSVVTLFLSFILFLVTLGVFLVSKLLKLRNR